MIIGAHIVVPSRDPKADHKFFNEVLGLTAIDAGGGSGDGKGYMIFGLPKSEASIHPTDGEVPHHELYFLCEDVGKFTEKLVEQGIAHEPVKDAGWGLIVKLTLPSGAPLNVYQPRHARP